MFEVDARGLSCPEPLMMTRNALKKESGSVKVLVDDAIARSNIEKFVKKEGRKLTVNENGSEFELIIE